MKFFTFKRLDLFRRPVTLRLDEDYFRTTCGASTSLVLILILISTFIYDLHEVYAGKVDKFQFMIKNTNKKMMWRASDIENAVFGIGIDGNYLEHEGYLQLKYGAVKSGNRKLNMKFDNLYDCTNTVYQNLVMDTKRKVHRGMKIYCFNTTAEIIDNNYYPYFQLEICKNSPPIEIPLNGVRMSNSTQNRPKVVCKSTQ